MYDRTQWVKCTATDGTAEIWVNLGTATSFRRDRTAKGTKISTAAGGDFFVTETPKQILEAELPQARRQAEGT